MTSWIPTRDPSFVARTAAEYDEYVQERIAIGVYERGMTEAEATKAALVMAGPRPGEATQTALGFAQTNRPQQGARGEKRAHGANEGQRRGAGMGGGR